MNFRTMQSSYGSGRNVKVIQQVLLAQVHVY
jgi:hypothetical protein